jgi:glutathione S-transferase
MTRSNEPFVLFGVSQSYFTRKMSGYLDYKALPWRLKRFGGGNAEVRAAGWTGGIPAGRTADGEIVWDTTAMILHLEHGFPEPAVLPPDPVQRFLCFLLEDFSDEWLYRPAVGSRWLFEENTTHGSWDLARDMSVEFPITADQARQMVQNLMQGSIQRLAAWRTSPSSAATPRTSPTIPCAVAGPTRWGPPSCATPTA